MRSRVVSGISLGFPGLSQSQGQVTHVLLTRSPLEYPRRGLSARLACVRHAASVRPEPGSNSPSRSYDISRPHEEVSSTSTHEKRTTPARTADMNVIRLTKGTHHDEQPASGCHRGRGVNLASTIIWHAVEFSRIGRTPSTARQGHSRGNSSNLAYPAVRGQTRGVPTKPTHRRPCRAAQRPAVESAEQLPTGRPPPPASRSPRAEEKLTAASATTSNRLAVTHGAGRPTTRLPRSGAQHCPTA